MMKWHKLPVGVTELQLVGTLNGGQSFRWAYDEKKNEWTGTFSKTVWRLRQKNDEIQYSIVGSLLDTAIPSEAKKKKVSVHVDSKPIFDKIIGNYFRLDVDLAYHYKDWLKKDALFQKACEQFFGIRMLCQEPVENLFSFICSQNNHISRISSMVEKLCQTYGEQICTENGKTYYSFPEVDALCNAKVENELRDLGFGYRAKFIQKSAEQIVEWGGLKWFNTLQEMKYKDARIELMKLHGIGPKVADCICLMSLGHLESVPVDTHVYQIAAQNYLPHLRGKKNVTDKMYTEIGDYFRSLYGPLAGWAHTVLFCADLKKFQQSTGEVVVNKLKSRGKCKRN